MEKLGIELVQTKRRFNNNSDVDVFPTRVSQDRWFTDKIEQVIALHMFKKYIPNEQKIQLKKWVAKYLLSPENPSSV